MRRSLTWVIVFVAGLLVGFVPQFWKAHVLRGDLAACNAQLDLAKVRRSAAITYVSTTQLNYGLASGSAQQFFTDAQALASSTTDANVRSLMTEVLASRDKITADLAKGSSDAVAELQPLVLKIEQFQP